MKKLILPGLMIVLAITSAFTTDASKKSTMDDAIVFGHIRMSLTDPKQCEDSEECETSQRQIVCRVGQDPAGDQIWRKNGAGECIITLYKPDENR